MELDIILHSVFSSSKSKIQKSTNQLKALMDKDRVKYNELKQIAKDNDAVILIEVEQDDGYVESILVNNIGKIIERGHFSIEMTGKIRSKINPLNCNEYFTKEQLAVINKYIVSHGISYEDFLNENLDEYLYYVYEQQRIKWGQNIKQYYTN